MRNRIKNNREIATDGLKWFVLLFLLVSAGSCKKYPENTLWFKNPKNINPFRDTKLTKYSVNGIDSLELLNKYFGHAPDLVRDIHQAKFLTYRVSSHATYEIRFGEGGYNLDFTYMFLDKNRKIVVSMIQDTNIYSKQLFVSHDTKWEIQRLERTGPFKIKTRLENGNVCEIEIE